MNPESLPQVKPGDSVKADHHNSLVKAVRRRTPVSSPTIKIVETSSGFYCETVRNASVGGGGPEYAWTPKRVNDELIEMSAGSISDGVTTRTPNVSAIAVSATALQYIYLVCTLNVTRIDGFVTGGTVTAASVITYSGIQTNNDTTGYILLCTWQAGAIVDRFRYWSIECQINDNGGGGTAFNTWTAG